MVRINIAISPNEDRVLNKLKEKFQLKSKEEVIKKLIRDSEEIEINDIW